MTHDINGDFDGVIATGDGGFCLVGNGNRGDSPGLALVKIGPDGKMKWQKSYESADYELKITCGVELIDSSLLMTGPSTNFRHMFLMKTDSEGKAEWLREVDGAFVFYLASVEKCSGNLPEEVCARTFTNKNRENAPTAVNP
jgi:hypothetical protein